MIFFCNFTQFSLDYIMFGKVYRQSSIRYVECLASTYGSKVAKKWTVIGMSCFFQYLNE